MNVPDPHSRIKNRVLLGNGFHGPYRKPGISAGAWRVILAGLGILVPIYVIGMAIYLKW